MSDGRREALRILQINTADEGGGAASVADGLRQTYRERGCRVWQAVGHKRSRDADLLVLPDEQRAAYRWSGYSALQSGVRRLAARHPNRGWGLLSRSLRSLTHPQALIDRSRGIEDFEFPGTYSVLDLIDEPADIVHGHNLHGGYFDLRALAWLSQSVPTLLTLHDMWMLTGHCAHSLDCERWVAGCGECPSLDLYPAVRRDATNSNWKRKQCIYEQSHLYVATPSRWLFDRVQRSMMAPAIRAARIIPNGINLSVFRPADKRCARAALGLRADASIVLLTPGSQNSMWKDDRLLKRTMEQIAKDHDHAITFIAIGRDAPLPAIGRSVGLTRPYQSDPSDMAKYYQAADVYLHAARADTFPLAVLEALACGTPVVATAVGGVPEQIRATSAAEIRSGSLEALSTQTGILVPAGDAPAMADAVTALLSRDDARLRLGQNAARDAAARFDLNHQVDAYLDWYRTIIDDWKATRTQSAHAD